MSLISVAEAMAAILDGVAPVGIETVAIADADGRILAEDVIATRDQPPFPASAMDGYAVRAADVATLPATLDVIGESAAGQSFAGVIGPGQTVRIFTGAPIPAGGDAIVIQENTTRDRTRVTVTEGALDPAFVRRHGSDFTCGTTLIAAGTKLSARTLTLAAASGRATLLLRRRPRVALIATGNELVLPGDTPNANQIICSNPFGIAAIVSRAGGAPRFVGIARDTTDDLNAAFDAAVHGQAESPAADIVVTIGGASVGDHDLVAPVLTARGLKLDFMKVAMRPGKPLMFGRANGGGDGHRGTTRYLGLPGNPVSSLICARVFLAPLIEALLGQPPSDQTPRMAPLDVPLEANGPRKHYMRATLDPATGTVAPVRSQDSSLLTLLASADALIVREPHADALLAGDLVPVLKLDF